MRPLPYAADANVSVDSIPLRMRLADLKELLKPGISGFIVATTAAGYLLGVSEAAHWPTMIGLLLGTAMTSGGAGALNHLVERRYDAQMHRTQGRPLPAGRIRPGAVLAYGLLFVLGGLGILGLTTNLTTTVLALATVVLYVGIYTPLKRKTTWNTIVGAVPGALPILGGVTAASGSLDAMGWSAFAILFLWQLPHFYAIAWRLREDYARGGFVMLPTVEPSGTSTGWHVLIATLLLLVAGLVPTALGGAGWLYFLGMAGLGTAFTLPAFSFFSEPTDNRARRLLLASIIYVPAFLALVVVDFLIQ